MVLFFHNYVCKYFQLIKYILKRMRENGLSHELLADHEFG